jgi:hypothetical protein
MSLILKRSEVRRLLLELDSAPTGTPTVAIYRDADPTPVEVLAATSMTVKAGTSNLIWEYVYTTGASATVGSHNIEYSAVIDGVTRFAYEPYYQSINNIDSLADDIAAVPTVGEIDTELSGTHGAGSWLSGTAGTGAYNATIHVQDQNTNDVADAHVTIHNATDDDTPVIADGYTDANGDVTLNIEGNIYVRVSKAGFTYTSTTKNITSSATYTVSGTVDSVSNPIDPDVCRLRIFPITLGNADITDLATSLKISSKGRLTKISGQFISNDTLTWTYDSSTTPDSYYFDAVRLAGVRIECDELGIDADVLVPDAATYDISGYTNLITTT